MISETTWSRWNLLRQAALEVWRAGPKEPDPEALERLEKAIIRYRAQLLDELELEAQIKLAQDQASLVVEGLVQAMSKWAQQVKDAKERESVERHRKEREEGQSTGRGRWVQIPAGAVACNFCGLEPANGLPLSGRYTHWCEKAPEHSGQASSEPLRGPQEQPQGPGPSEYK